MNTRECGPLWAKRIFARILALVVLTGSATQLPAAKISGTTPRIVDVRGELVSAEAKPTRSYLKQRSTKFSTYRETSAYQLFYITWDAGTSLAPGTMLLFEYQLANTKVRRALKVACPAHASGGKRTTLTIPPEEIATGGAVKAWRVRMTQGQQTVAHLFSQNWNRP